MIDCNELSVQICR